jgi:phosphatidylglycerol:prolipoprotein diacylglycerol transferase
MYPEIRIFGDFVDTWELCLFVSFCVVTVAAVLLRPKDFFLSRAGVFWTTIAIFISGFIGAKLLGIFLGLESAIKSQGAAPLQTGRTAYLGAPFIVILILWIICLCRRISFLELADYVFPFLMLERVIGRIGCLGAGCCYGIKSNLPWAYPFKYGFIGQHPTQAYELIYACAIFLSSRYLYKNRSDMRGITLYYVIFSYSALRFFNEFIRAEGPFVFDMIKVSHIALFIFAVAGAVGLYITVKKAKHPNEALWILKSSFLLLFLYMFIVGTITLTAITGFIKSNIFYR